METFEEHYDSMCAAIARRMPTADMDLIDKAVHYADDKHRQQKRKDGSPYIIHPLAVAEIVAEMGLDQDAILGALLHDASLLQHQNLVRTDHSRQTVGNHDNGAATGQLGKRLLD